MEVLIDGMFLVGYIKGGIYYGLGDYEKGKNCMIGFLKFFVVFIVGICIGGVVVVVLVGVGIGIVMDVIVGVIDRDEYGYYKF